MTPEELEALVAAGEVPTVEFKLTLPPESIVARYLVAFANTNGGTLVIGVDSRGDIVGLSDADATEIEERLRRITSSLFAWPVEVGSVDVRGRRVVYVQVPKAPDHFFPVSTATGQYFHISEQGLEPLVFGRGAGPREGVPEKVVAFVAMSFRTEEEPALVDYYEAMKRAANGAGYPISIDRIDYPGDFEISQEIMDRIRAADIVIADFTLSPANVYFEAGLARGCQKRMIQISRKDTLLEFDVRNWKTTFYRNATELEAKLGSELVAAYGDVMAARRGDSPSS